jgi:hypothetical protein
MTGFFLADEPPPLPYPANDYLSTSELAWSVAACVFTFFDKVGEGNDDKCSPLLVETLYWWLERWGYTYLFSGNTIDGCLASVPIGNNWQSLAYWCVARMRKDVERWPTEKEVISQVLALTVMPDSDNTYAKYICKTRPTEARPSCLWYVFGLRC